MKKQKFMRTILLPFCLFISSALILMALSGCTGSKFRTSRFSKSTTASKKTSAQYFDFGDVLIPAEMKRDNKNSFVYRTPGFAAGVLSLKGRVELNSLVSFFENNMSKDNWITVSSFKSPRTILLFQKENRFCVISIDEKEFSTRVEIWVAPTITGNTITTEEGLIRE